MKTERIMSYFDRLFPLCRSLTGAGVRETLSILREVIPLDIHEVASGTRCFDWTVPPEWNVRDAFVATLEGKRLIDFRSHNLHLMSYSVPINAILTHAELMPRIATIPDKPTAIPYRTSYYNDNWGFCLQHDQLHTLDQDHYRVVIDSDKKNGSMTYGDLVLKGQSDEEVLISTYICHPSMANNELSGPLVTAFLYEKIAALPVRRYTYRFIFVPETIGAIYYLQRHGSHMKEKTCAGFVLTCCGDGRAFTYKKSRAGDTLADRAAVHVLKQLKKNPKIVDFFPSGSDERQYCSPGFNLPVGSLMRTMYGDFPEYHSSLDNRGLVSEKSFEESIETFFHVIKAIEANATYVSLNPFCEPQLGRRGLYPTTGGGWGADAVKAQQYILNYSDGSHDLIDIAERAELDVLEIALVAERLSAAGLLAYKESEKLNVP